MRNYHEGLSYNVAPLIPPMTARGLIPGGISTAEHLTSVIPVLI